MKHGGPRRSLAAIEVVVSFGSKTYCVTGRAALLIAWIASCAERINSTPVGRLAANFAHSQLKLELTESLPAIRLDD